MVWVTFGVLATVLIVAALFDLTTRRVPNALTYPAIVLGIALASVGGLVATGPGGAWHGFESSVVALFAALVPMAVIFALGGMGGGDVKLMGAVGAITASCECVLSAMFYAFVCGAVIGIVVMIKRGVARQTATRMMSVAMQIAARTKPEIPADSPRIPFALAIAAGGILAAAEVLLGLHLPWS